ncbi:hypothetical protein [Hymenobacter terricola]|uniref:hypothetical protein n=1 Tax=Hymenobacter terricola TaxID=2819236 RepID=UPI001B3002C4|nr:hypothetical protein [Hymenobacter terricola]
MLSSRQDRGTVRRRTGKRELGHVRNVRSDNVACRGENGILVDGTAESLPEDLAFRHVRFDFADSPLSDVAGGNVDLPATFPASSRSTSTAVFDGRNVQVGGRERKSQKGLI